MSTTPTPRFPQTLDLLDALLAGEAFGPGDLDEVMARFKKEDQYLEFKDGRASANPDAAKVVRLYVTGFANAVGGVLIIGVTEPNPPSDPRRVNGTAAPGSSTLTDWATRILARSAGFLSPSPAIREVSHPDGKVLVIAVARAPQLVPFVEEGELAYSIRIGDSTLEMEPYLISDLVLGRRNHPVLELRTEAIRLYCPQFYPEKRMIRLNVSAKVENRSLMSATAANFGSVSWSLSEHPATASTHLLQWVDAEKPADSYDNDSGRLFWEIRHSVAGPISIGPFDVVEATIEIAAYVPRSPPQGRISLGLYLMAHQGPPTFYEISANYRTRATSDKNWVEVGAIKFARATGKLKPRLRWEAAEWSSTAP